MLVICCLFDTSHSDRYEEISYWGFDWYFPGLVLLSTSSCVCWPFVCLLHMAPVGLWLSQWLWAYWRDGAESPCGCLLSLGWAQGWVPSTNRLEGGFQNGAYQHWCHCSTACSQNVCSHYLHSLEASQLPPASFKFIDWLSSKLLSDSCLWLGLRAYEIL